MSPHIAQSLVLSSALLAAAFSIQAAEPWQPMQILTPPAGAGYNALSQIGFGRVVAMSDQWLAVAAPAASCPSPAGNNYGAVLMYRFEAATPGFEYTQQLCNTGIVYSIALSDEWLVLGSPYDDDTPGDGEQHGRLRFFQLSGATPQWTLRQTAVGAADGLLGTSVAIDGGVVAAGELGYNDHRGRVQSWRLNAIGTAWVSEGYLGPGLSPLDWRVSPNEGFGSALALNISGCRAPSCPRPHDTLIVQSRSGLHSVERLASGWGSRELVKPVRGTGTAFSPVAVNDSIAVASAIVTSGDVGDSPCPWIGPDFVTSMTRVLTRTGGSAHLRAKGFACLDQLGVSPLRSASATVALAAQGSEFVVGSRDFPADYVGIVATWELVGASGRIVPTDFVVDLDYTEAYHAATAPSTFYDPRFTGDYFGAGLARFGDRLAVGAPMYNALLNGFGAGYVVIYTR